MTQDQPTVRIGQLAELLGVPTWTIRRWADAGLIPVESKSGNQRRFDATRVIATLSESGLRSAPNEERYVGLTPVKPITAPAWAKTYALDGLQEHLVWADVMAGADLDPRRAATRLLEYSVEEMVNNAIDHSGGDRVTVRVWTDPDRHAFQVADDGEGIFEHLRRGLSLTDDLEAIAILSKGKQTTWPERHSGEGIFFTSKMNDIFRIEANGKSWTVDNLRSDQSVGEITRKLGTSVYGEIDPATSRTSTEVFQRFTDEDLAFSRTRPSVKLASLGLRFASRSEARRLLEGLDDFTTIDVDFAGVPEVGQGFVDEIFRVWASLHPDKELHPINMNSAVEFMIRRGLAAASRPTA